MTTSHKQMLKCPKCSSESEALLYETINTTSPGVETGVCDGSIFAFHCRKCGHKTRLDYPVLYNNMEKNSMVQYVLSENVQQCIESWKSLGVDSKLRLRVVDSQFDLREKAMIMAAGLDDRIIEIQKILTMFFVIQDKPELKIEKVFFFSMGGETGFELLGDENMHVPFDLNQYDSIAERAAEALKDDENEYIVNSDWAYKFLSENFK